MSSIKTTKIRDLIKLYFPGLVLSKTKPHEVLSTGAGIDKFVIPA